MGDEVRGVPSAPALDGQALDAPGLDGAAGGIGRYLARQRELRGISLDDLVSLTKIPRRSLERLEAGAFDQQPDGFARGFVRTVAEALGLAPEDAVMRLMQEPDAEEQGDAAGAVDSRVRFAGMAVLGAVALTLLLVGRLIVAWATAPEAVDDQSVVLRRDPVRALAEQSLPPPETDAAAVEPGLPPVDAGPAEPGLPPVDAGPAEPGLPPSDVAPGPGSGPILAEPSRAGAASAP